jgi:hypothetical protein
MPGDTKGIPVVPGRGPCNRVKKSGHTDGLHDICPSVMAFAARVAPDDVKGALREGRRARPQQERRPAIPGVRGDE